MEILERNLDKWTWFHVSLDYPLYVNFRENIEEGIIPCYIVYYLDKWISVLRVHDALVDLRQGKNYLARPFCF